MKRLKSELINEIINSKNLESGIDSAKSTITKYTNNIERERFDIKTEKDAKFYGKQIGRYELLSIPNYYKLSKSDNNQIIKILSEILAELLGEVDDNSKILVVGLGNRHISADSLGTKVIGGINVTFSESFPKVMAVCPSVLGLTGIETYDIISGIISKVKPTHLILIDSLCASSSTRLGKSIQLSNTGICPGSGIGNNRKCLDKRLVNNVVSIGVPLLIYASTFVEECLGKFDIDYSRLDSIMQSSKNSENKDEINRFCKDIKKCIDEDIDSEIVTIKDIEECVDYLSTIIYKSINISLGVNFE